MRTPRSRAARMGGVLLLSAIAGIGVASGAWAVNANNMVGNPNYDRECGEGGPGWGPVCRTDNAAVYYYMDSSGEFELETPDRDAVRATIANDYQPTDLSVTYDSSPVFSGDAETDVIYQEGTVSNGFTGYTWCNDNSPSPIYECDQTYIRIRGAGEYDRGLACHETGHAVGLLHGENAYPRTSNTDTDLGCMVTPVGNNVAIGANQRNRINNTY